MAKAMFGAGCFWGVEARFRQIEGVTDVAVGYSGGHLENPTYHDVCAGTTAHTEVVEVDYDPEGVTFEQLLDVFWTGHDPTTLNRQGPDMGTQYRSAIYFYSPEQEEVATKSKELLDAGLEVGAENGIGSTALLAAALNGHTETVKALLDVGVDINGKDENGETALVRAAFRGQTETVGALLDAGADVHVKTNNGVSPLMHAAFGGHIETVETLLDAGVDVNAKDDDGATSLMYSLLVRGDADLVKLLLDAGADVSEKSNDGWMALMLAEEDGHTEVVELLKQAGANE